MLSLHSHTPLVVMKHGTFFIAGVPTVNSTSHDKVPLLTWHDSSSCRAFGTGGLRLKTQVKIVR